MSTEEFVDLEHIKEKAGGVTKKELVYNALALLDWAMDEVKNGNIITSTKEDSDKYKQLCMPIFKRLR
jgi:hypothetical protein